MIARNLHRLKVEKTSANLTSFAGLPLLTELAHSTGTIDRLDAIPGLWKRKSEYTTADYILGLAVTLAAGGDTLDDTRLLRGDTALRSLALPSLPCANTLGDFLRRFDNRSLYRLSEAVTEQALLNIKPDQDITLDIDASLIESDKAEAKMTYKGFTGYNPLLAWLDGPDVFIGGVFRDGNASPQTHILSLLKYCHRRMPGINFKFRSDSAGYKLEVIRYCHANDIPFTITADINDAVRTTIDSIPEKDWRLMMKGEDTFLFAETVYAPGGEPRDTGMPAFRLVVTKKLGQLELFGDPCKRRAIISNLPADYDTEAVMDFHNGRGNAEKAIGELKNGYGLNKLPCGELKANAAYFQTALLAYNLVATLKNKALPEGWKNFGIKNLRFRLLCQAALVTRHARRIVIKLAETYPFFDVFERARWSVLSPALSGA